MPAFGVVKSWVTVKGDSTDYRIYPYIEIRGDFEGFLAANLGPATRKNARGVIRLVESGEFRITQFGRFDDRSRSGTAVPLLDNQVAGSKRPVDCPAKKQQVSSVSCAAVFRSAMLPSSFYGGAKSL